jgi:NAD(P)-dependent dehydrogenase (short-subunit alcohol dehydrogenase family)
MTASWYRNKVLLVAGASRGIGKALVCQALAQGAAVVAMARTQQQLSELEQQASQQTDWSERLQILPVDLTQRQQVAEALNKAQARFGHIDIVIYCAAIEYLGPISALTPDELQSMLSANFTGLFHLVQLVLPIMQRQEEKGTIVWVSSPMARSAFPWSSAYAASKAAGDAFIAGLRHELGPNGPRFITIYPGPTRTEAGKQLPAERLPRWHEQGQKMEAERCAQLLLQAVARGRPIQTLGSMIRWLFLLQRWLPSLADRLSAAMPVGS